MMARIHGAGADINHQIQVIVSSGCFWKWLGCDLGVFGRKSAKIRHHLRALDRFTARAEMEVLFQSYLDLSMYLNGTLMIALDSLEAVLFGGKTFPLDVSNWRAT